MNQSNMVISKKKLVHVAIVTLSPRYYQSSSEVEELI